MNVAEDSKLIALNWMQLRYWDGLTYYYTEKPNDYLNRQKKAIKNRLSDLRNEQKALEDLLTYLKNI